MSSAKESDPGVQDIVQHVRQRIISGEYVGGEPLPPERELTAGLNVSRPVLREAMQQLAMLGMVELRRNFRARVRPRREWRLGVAPAVIAAHLGAGEPESVTDLTHQMLHLRRVVVHSILSIAGTNATPDALDATRQAVLDAWKAKGEPQRFAQLDLDITRTLADATGAHVALWLINTLSDVYLELAPAMFQLGNIPPADYVVAHMSTLDALERGDVQGACTLMDDYLKRVDEQIDRGFAGE